MGSAVANPSHVQPIGDCAEDRRHDDPAHSHLIGLGRDNSEQLRPRQCGNQRRENRHPIPAKARCAGTRDLQVDPYAHHGHESLDR